MDRDLFEKLYAAHYRALCLYVLAMVGQREAAEDIVQEAFLKALLSFPDDHPEFRRWLFVVARNMVLKKLSRERSCISLEESPEQAGRGPDVQERLALDEERRTLYEGLLTLPPGQREVLVLFYFSNLSHKEIADAMQISPETARIYAVRGKKKLKEYMEDRGYEFS